MLVRNFYIKDIANIAGPIILGNLGFIMIGVGDVIVAGRYSTDTLAAVSLATAIINCIMIFGIGILGSTSAILSNYRGAGKEAEKYKTKIDKIDCTEEINIEINGAILMAQKDVRKIIKDNSNKTIPIREAESKYNSLIREAELIQIKLKIKLDNILNEQLKTQAQDILNEYKERLKTLTEDLNVRDSFNLNVFAMIEDKIDDLNNKEDFIKNLEVVKKDVVVGEKKVSDSTWWKPWTWGDYHMENIYEKRDFYDVKELAIKFFAPFEKNLRIKQNEAMGFAEQQSEQIKNKFKKEFERLDEIIKDKLNQLEACATNKQDIDKRIKILEDNNNWLIKMKKEVNGILEI